MFLAPETVIFVFEGGNVNSVLASLGGTDEQAVLAAWEPLLDGTPTIASEAFNWVRPAPMSASHWGE